MNCVCYTYSAWCSSFRYTGPPVFSWKLYPFFKFSSRHTSAALIKKFKKIKPPQNRIWPFKVIHFLILQEISMENFICACIKWNVNKNKWMLHLKQKKRTWLAYLKWTRTLRGSLLRRSLDRRSSNARMGRVRWL